MEKFEAFTVSGIVIISAFLLTKHPDNSTNNIKFPLIGFLLPLFITIFGWLKYKSLNNVIVFYNDYLQQTEEMFANTINLTNNFRESKYDRGFSLGFIHSLFWFLLFIFSILIFLTNVTVCL